jgi:hypothetical protein
MKNIEYRTPNVEGKEKLFTAFKVFYFHPSTFDIHYSTFNIQKTEPFGSGYAGLCTSNSNFGVLRTGKHKIQAEPLRWHENRHRT